MLLREAFAIGRIDRWVRQGINYEINYIKKQQFMAFRVVAQLPLVWTDASPPSSSFVQSVPLQTSSKQCLLRFWL